MGGTIAVIGVLSGFDMAPIAGRRGDAEQPARHRDHGRQCARSPRDCARWSSEAGIKPHISHVFDWEQLDEALRVMRAGEHVGKIALTIP